MARISPVTFDHAASSFAATVTFPDGPAIRCRLRMCPGTSADIVVPALLRQADEKRRKRPLAVRSRLMEDGSISLS